MNIGKVVRIHNIPDPQEPERRYYPQPLRNPFIKTYEPKEQPIPVPDWPVKVPEKVEAE